MSISATSPEAMDRMIKNIVTFLDLQSELVESLKRDYSAVGDEWNDPNYEKLGAIIEEAIIGIRENYPLLSMSVTKLQMMRNMLEDYLRLSF